MRAHSAATGHDASEETVTLRCADDVELRGTVSRPNGAPRYCVLLSSGAGYKRGFYRPLATHLASVGALVLTYDNRGVGGSSTPALLRTAALRDWGAQDQAAGYRWLRDATPGAPVFHIAHSISGHVAGFSAHAAEFDKQLFIASGVGTFWLHHPARWPLELYFWWGLGVYSLARHGHLASIGGWGGAALPAPVFRAWRAWSHRLDYMGAVVAPGERAHFDAVTTPLQSWVFPDDGIATRAAARKVLSAYPNADAELVLVHPREHGLARLGHDGVFRRGGAALWPRITAFLEG